MLRDQEEERKEKYNHIIDCCHVTEKIATPCSIHSILLHSELSSASCVPISFPLTEKLELYVLSRGARLLEESATCLKVRVVSRRIISCRRSKFIEGS